MSAYRDLLDLDFDPQELERLVICEGFTVEELLAEHTKETDTMTDFDTALAAIRANLDAAKAEGNAFVGVPVAELETVLADLLEITPSEAGKALAETPRSEPTTKGVPDRLIGPYPAFTPVELIAIAAAERAKKPPAKPKAKK